MSQFIIVNGTKQKHRLCHRETGRNQILWFDLEPFSQQPVPAAWSLAEQMRFVQMLEDRFGAKKLDSISSVMPVGGLFYTEGKAAAKKQIEEIGKERDKALDKRAQEMMDQTAVMIDKLAMRPVPGADVGAEQAEVEVQSEFDGDDARARAKAIKRKITPSRAPAQAA